MPALDAMMKCQQELLDKLEKKKVHKRETFNSVICREMFGTTELESGK